MNSIIKHFLAFIFVTISVLNGNAVRNTQLLNSHEVLASSYTAFANDNDGYLWIGTQYGLLRYDGAHFTKYQYIPNDEKSLSSNHVLSMLYDENGRLWIGTDNGLNLYDAASDSFVHISLPNISIGGFVFTIDQMGNGDIIFMASGVGLFTIDPTNEQHEAVQMSLQNYDVREINTLAESKNGEIIAGCHNGNLLKIAANNSAKVYRKADSYFKILLRGSDDMVFAATTTRAWLWNTDNDVFTELDLPAGMSSYMSNAITTSNGDILVGTLGNGPLILRKGSHKLEYYRDLYNSSIDIQSSRISSLLEDRCGNLWLGCSSSGIVIAPKRDYPFFTINIDRLLPGAVGSKILLATHPESQKIWAAFDIGAIQAINSHGKTLWQKKFDRPVGSIFASKSGKVYFGIDDRGYFEVDTATYTVKQVFKRSGNYRANAITEDLNGSLYFALHGEGIVVYNPSTGDSHKLVDPKGVEPYEWTSSLFCDSKGRVWLGKFGSLSLYDPQTGIHSSVSDGNLILMGCVHNGFAEAPDGKIWDVASNGINIHDVDAGTFQHLSTSDGLSSAYISSILFDKNGNAWCSTSESLDMIDSTFNVTSFHSTANVGNKEFESLALLGDGNRICASGNFGITILNSDIFAKKEFTETVTIPAIYLDNKKLTPTSDSRFALKFEMSQPIAVKVAHDDNPLNIHVSMTNFHPSENLVFQWCIPGVYNDWVSIPIGMYQFNLPRLPYGKHSLQIRAQGNGESTAIRTLQVEVTPPWYLTWPAKLFYFMLICFVLYLILKYTQHKRDEIIGDEKIKFFINLSHEVRTPLTLILGPIERMMKKETDPEILRNLSTMQRNANRILVLFNQMLDIRKINKGKMELHRRDTDLVAFTSDLVDMFKQQANVKNQTLTFNVAQGTETNGLNVWIDRNNFDKVLVNLVSNAIKYTPADGTITIEVGEGNNDRYGHYARLSVIDTGIGLDPKTIDNLFERFYQGRNKENAPLGFGIGLHLCKMLVEMHNGTISARNRTDAQGSIFEVFLPIVEPGTMDEEAPSETPERSLSQYGVLDEVPKAESPQKISRRANAARILVVDDDADICAYLSELLSSVTSVEIAGNGEEAMKIILAKTPDIVISDVVMPVMDGITLLKTIKSNVETNHIPVVLLSTKSDVESRKSGWNKGADAYISKPFNNDELLAIVDNLIDNRLRLRGKFSGAQQQDENIESPDVKSNNTILSDRIVAIINEQYTDPELNVEILCREVGLSRAHLNRKMKEIFGLSPSEFIRNVRLTKACELLKNPDIDISVIAYNIGFSSQPHFSTAFKKFTGLSPTEYRANNVKQ